MKIVRSILIIGVLLSMSAFGYYQYKNPEKQALGDSARTSATGAFAKLSAGTTHYEVAGPDNGRVAVLVHGFSVPSYIWDPTFAALGDAGYKVIRFDLYGRGLSDRPDAAYDGQFYDTQIDDLLAALNVKQPVDLFGLSFGGYVVAHYAATHPQKIRTITLVDPSNSRAQLPWHRTVPGLGSYLFQVDELPGKAEGQSSDFLHPEQFPGWAERYRPQMTYIGFGRALRRSSLRLATADFEGIYTAIDKAEIPVLLVWGRQDKVVPIAGAENIKRFIPKLDFFEIDQSGHLPHMEQPAIFNARMLAFLEAHPSVASPIMPK
ncbi:MAG: alpha/beta hydrolase [Undibacterium sp.]|nr:alpha/beta hydrolase [Undibacterium sp.]